MAFAHQTPTQIYRLLCLMLFVVCIGLVATAIIIGKIDHLEPCPLCILQRIAFLALGFIALLGVVYSPPALMVRLGHCGLALIVALVGLGIAAWHAYLQYAPPRLSCGPDLAYMVNNWTLARLLPAVFRGAGECTKIDWALLGLSMPIWSAMAFAVMAGGMLVYLIRQKV